MKKTSLYKTTLFLALMVSMNLWGQDDNYVWANRKIVKKQNFVEMRGELPPEVNAERDTSEKELVFSSVDRGAMYPDGQQGLLRHIGKHFKTPVDEEGNKIYGKVYINFIVEKDGYIRELKVLWADDPALGEEGVRVIKSLDRFIPALVEGEPVRMSYIIPINSSGN
jgi:outer membrane biosynthesis protein TonB